MFRFTIRDVVANGGGGGGYGRHKVCLMGHRFSNYLKRLNFRPKSALYPTNVSEISPSSIDFRMQERQDTATTRATILEKVDS